MSRTRIVVLVVGLLVLGALSFVAIEGGWGGGTKRSAPVAIFVVIDTLRADRTSLCGYRHPTTPVLDDLVDDGASHACFAHSPSTWTLPSHASFFTGVALDGHGAGDGGGPQEMSWGTVTPLGPELPTLAEKMSDRGYQTLLISGNPVVAERMGLTRGFDHVAIARRYPMFHDHRLAERLKGLLRVARLDPARPLFVFVNIADAHSPWTAIPDDFDFLPPRGGLSIQPGRDRYESGEMSAEESEQYLAHLSDVYDYAVWRADRSLGQILDVLEGADWLDGDYRLVITSDHGEYLGEHQMVEHGREFFYEPVTRVPFVYYDTAAKLELPNDTASILAHSLMLDGSLPEPPPTAFASEFRQPDELGESSPPCSAARAALWEAGRKLVADRGRVTRFDLAADPGEQSPLPADREALAPELLEHCRALDAAYLGRPAVELDPAMLKQLRELGYVE